MKTAIVLHHSADPSARDQFAKIQAYHNRGAGGKWPSGHGIQYHFLIEASGKVVHCKPEDSVVWHAGAWKWNEISIGICLAGDFTQHEPTEKQIDALTKLVTDLQIRWGIQDQSIYLHKEIRPKPTACPGTDLRFLVLNHRRKMLELKVEQLENAQRWASPSRLKRITRILARMIAALS